MLKSLFLALLYFTNSADYGSHNQKALLACRDVHKKQDHFNHNDFLTSWDDSSFTMGSAITIAFERHKNNLREQREAKKVNYYDATREEQALEKLSSNNLALGHIRIRYPDVKGHATSYLQLENSYCWHSADYFPALYVRNEKRLLQQADELRKLISSEKKPKASVHLSHKNALTLSSQSQKTLYTIDLDFTK